MEAFMIANLGHPIAFDRDIKPPPERLHQVVSRFVTNENGEIGIDGNSKPAISLFTVAADVWRLAFGAVTPRTDFKCEVRTS